MTRLVIEGTLLIAAFCLGRFVQWIKDARRAMGNRDRGRTQ